MPSMRRTLRHRLGAAALVLGGAVLGALGAAAARAPEPERLLAAGGVAGAAVVAAALLGWARRRRRRDALALRIVGEAVMVLDRRGVLLGWNPAAERMYGYAAAEASGRD
jgi:PAS domain-containing protein